MSRHTKAFVAAVDAVIVGVAAYNETGGRFTASAADLVLWGATIAAALCALVVLSEGSATLAWAAIGYVLFGALLTVGSPHWPLAALAVALMPLVPRPNGSFALGLVVAVAAALLARTLVTLLV